MVQQRKEPTLPHRVSARVHAKMRLASQVLGITMVEIVDQAVEDWLERHKGEIAEKLKEMQEKAMAL